MFGGTCLGCLFQRNNWRRCFCCYRDCNAFVQVYISWAIRQRSRSCKVLMIHELHSTCTDFFTLNYQSSLRFQPIYVSLLIFWKSGLMTRQLSSAIEERLSLTLSQVYMRARWNLKLLMKVVLHSMILWVIFYFQLIVSVKKKCSMWNEVCICLQHRWQSRPWPQSGHSNPRTWSQRK